MTTSIAVTVSGLQAVLERIEGAGPRLAASLRETVWTETFSLQRHVVEDKLSGQVLHVRSGNLRRSITATVEETEGELRGIVGTNLVYAAIHEYGGVVHVPALRPVRAKALHWVGPSGDVFAMSTKAHTVTIPERSYLRSSLAERKPEILTSILAAIRKAFRK